VEHFTLYKNYLASSLTGAALIAIGGAFAACSSFGNSATDDEPDESGAAVEAGSADGSIPPDASLTETGPDEEADADKNTDAGGRTDAGAGTIGPCVEPCADGACCVTSTGAACDVGGACTGLQMTCNATTGCATNQKCCMHPSIATSTCEIACASDSYAMCDSSSDCALDETCKPLMCTAAMMATFSPFEICAGSVLPVIPVESGLHCTL
jgi:hypothetical protein